MAQGKKTLKLVASGGTKMKSAATGKFVSAKGYAISSPKTASRSTAYSYKDTAGRRNSTTVVSSSPVPSKAPAKSSVASVAPVLGRIRQITVPPTAVFGPPRGLGNVTEFAAIKAVEQAGQSLAKLGVKLTSVKVGAGGGLEVQGLMPEPLALDAARSRDVNLVLMEAALSSGSWIDDIDLDYAGNA